MPPRGRPLRLILVLGLLPLLVFTYSGVAAKDANTDLPPWIDGTMLTSDLEFFYTRASGASEQEARDAAIRELAEFMRVDVTASSSDSSSVVRVSGEGREREALLTECKTFTEAQIRGAQRIAHAYWAGEHWVLMRFPRSELPSFTEQIKDRRFPPPRERAVISLRGQEALLGAGAMSGLRLDDELELDGVDPDVPLIRTFARGWLSDLSSGDAVLQLEEPVDLPPTTLLWFKAVHRPRIGVVFRVGVSQFEAPRFSAFALDYRERGSAPMTGVGLEISLAALGLSELWALFEPVLVLAAPVTNIGANIGARKALRLGRFDLGLGFAAGARWRVLDTEGIDGVQENGAPPGSLHQFSGGGLGWGELGIRFGLPWSLRLRVGAQYFTSSGSWSGRTNTFREFGYEARERGVFGDLGLRVGF